MGNGEPAILAEASPLSGKERDYGSAATRIFAARLRNDGAPRDRTGCGGSAALEFAVRNGVPAMQRVPIQEGLPGLARLRTRDGQLCARLLFERGHLIRVTIRSAGTSTG